MSLRNVSHVELASITSAPQRFRTVAVVAGVRYNLPLCFLKTAPEEAAVKVLSSLKSAKQRHRDCKIVRRRGKVFVICKSNPRFKARQR